MYRKCAERLASEWLRLLDFLPRGGSRHSQFPDDDGGGAAGDLGGFPWRAACRQGGGKCGEEGISGAADVDFAFDGNGMLRIGAVETMDGHCYYANADGGLGKGFIGQFYAGPDYDLVSGWFEYGGQKFYAQADGRLVKGKMIIDGVLHQFTDGGMLIE